VFNDPLLDLIKPEMIFIKYLSGVAQIEVIIGELIPW
jgi:hypothetical protein